MNAVATITPWLLELGDELDVGDLAPDAQGVCTFSHHWLFELNIAAADDEPLLQLYAPILAVPERNRLLLFRTLLEFNLLGQKTNGTTLSLEPDGKSVVLSYAHPVELLDYTAFANLVRNVLDIATDLQRQLEQLKNAEVDSKAEDQQKWIQSNPQFLA